MTDAVLQKDDELAEPASPLGWIAVYGEDDYLYQYNDDGSENGYGDIDRERLKEFHIINKDTGKHVFAMSLDEGQRLIYRKRVQMSGISGEKVWEIFLVGWQQTIKGKNVQSISWIFPDGSIIQTGKFNENHPIFYSPELLDFEK